MKSAVETLSPTRVKLTVEVPFEELQQDVTAAYRKVGAQVRVPGFRPGKVPPRIIDQRVGRAVVLQEAVEEAVPRLYGEAVRDNEVRILGHPTVDVTDFTDREQLVFTAEVDVRPEFTLPTLDAVAVSVDDLEVTDADVDAQLDELRDTFASLRPVERPVERGDFVSIDLVATVDGEAVEGGEATGLSYEVGSDSLVPGLDDALLGASAQDSRTFTSELVAGPHAGKPAEVTVTVRAVKVKELPELDDEFAQLASEFDTVEAMRADVRDRVSRTKAMQQGMQARDRVLEALVSSVDVPLPESVLAAEVDNRRQQAEQSLVRGGLTLEAYAAREGRTVEDVEQEIAAGAEQALRAQLVLDALAEREQVEVGEAELSEHLVHHAQRVQMDPQAYADFIVRSGRLGALFEEVRRGKALAMAMEGATITDASGRPVDLRALAATEDEDADDAATGQASAEASESADGSSDQDDSTEAGAQLPSSAEDVDPQVAAQAGAPQPQPE